MFLFYHSEEDLYRGEEELSASQPELETKRQYILRFYCISDFQQVQLLSVIWNLDNSLFVLPIVSPFSAIPRSVLKVEDRCSLSPVVNILLYSEREWKGNTLKSALIKKVGAWCFSEESFQVKASSYLFIFTLMARMFPLMSPCVGAGL